MKNNKMRIENDRRAAREILKEINTIEDIKNIEDDCVELTEIRKVPKTKMKEDKDAKIPKGNWERISKRNFEAEESEERII